MAGEVILPAPRGGMGAMLRRMGAPIRSALLWGAGAALVGALVGLTLEMLTHLNEGQYQGGGDPFDWWFVWQSVLSAEAVCLCAIVVVRYTLPQYDGMAALSRYALIMVSLLGGTFVATAFSLLTRPAVLIARPMTFLALAIMNSLLAMMLGASLITWETLRRSLEKSYEQLREKEAIEREMSVAREVQRDLLPDGPPVVPGYDVAFVCRSAEAVGGDTVDFVPLPGERLGLVIGDVVGKGIAAALQMANVQALVRALAPLEENPQRLNTLISEAVGARMKPGRFITLAYVMLDPPSGSLRYSLAGHHPPIIFGPQGTRELERGGLPLGILAGIPYEEGSDCLQPGESMILFTDGVIEAPPEDGSDDEFGKDRVVAIGESAYRFHPQEMLERILSELDSFRGRLPAFDDTTLVIVRRLPVSEAS